MYRKTLLIFSFEDRKSVRFLVSQLFSNIFYSIENGETYPDITFLPALANIFETSVDLLIGMNTIRAEETRLNIHKKAIEYQKNGEYDLAEKNIQRCLVDISQ